MRSTATLFSAEGLWTGTRPRPGHSPLSLVNDHLIREAQRDLVYSGLTIKQIAHALGFEHAACFSRHFRKQTGVTPTEFQAAAHRDLSLDWRPVRSTGRVLLHRGHAHVVFRHRRRCRARGRHVFEFGHLKLLLERRRTFDAVHHAGHPV
jgi:AraC-like DNA-binding protein